MGAKWNEASVGANQSHQLYVLTTSAQPWLGQSVHAMMQVYAVTSHRD